ncbi:putative phosphoglycerate mutase family protein [Streptomyces sp. NBRC 110611]|uniref:histidine phosphatase family protein n=1 Tax=Streptomyces sp. NBRC 110611 TaxID=1621259 RepID=UPI00083342CD|nr:histidine phosphatase family protein [Streptomyces sp. NBRC 110611]GAU65756.1 putative phosphoglycerate mutase family protein [Streptomyces sp. NBRC 110611]
MAELLLVRHGETEWSRTGRHTGRTDLPLTEEGERRARALAPLLARWRIARALCSPLRRAARTAELVLPPGTGVRPESGLMEWDYGAYEGLTTAEIRRTRPGWDLWRDGVPPGDGAHPGETLAQVGERCDTVLARAAAALDEHDADVVLIAHGHVLRVLTARWLGQPAVDGALYRLDTSALCVLGTEHERRVITGWNLRPWPE